MGALGISKSILPQKEMGARNNILRYMKTNTLGGTNKKKNI
jgi:hypothetical protein